MIKAWRCRELNRIIIGDSISVSCDDCFSDKICTIKLAPCDAEEVVVIPKAEQLKVQAALAAAEEIIPELLHMLNQYLRLVPGEDKANEALTKIREVTK